jgi:hypothetical protein
VKTKMEGVFELCQSADGSLLFQVVQGWGQAQLLDLQPRDQAQLYSLAPLMESFKAARHVESQARDAIDVLAGARSCVGCVHRVSVQLHAA